MSREAVVSFLQEVAKDPDLQRELATFAAQHGYAFTADELAESDLAALSGGVTDLGGTLIETIAKKPGKKAVSESGTP